MRLGQEIRFLFYLYLFLQMNHSSSIWPLKFGIVIGFNTRPFLLLSFYILSKNDTIHSNIMVTKYMIIPLKKFVCSPAPCPNLKMHENIWHLLLNI